MPATKKKLLIISAVAVFLIGLAVGLILIKRNQDLRRDAACVPPTSSSSNEFWSREIGIDPDHPQTDTGVLSGFSPGSATATVSGHSDAEYGCGTVNDSERASYVVNGSTGQVASGESDTFTISIASDGKVNISVTALDEPGTMFVRVIVDQQEATPSPSPSPTPSPTPTASPTQKPTSSPTPSPSSSPSPSPTTPPVGGPSPTPSPSPTVKPTGSATLSPSQSSTPAASSTPESQNGIGGVEPTSSPTSPELPNAGSIIPTLTIASAAIFFIFFAALVLI